jgi:hypothetical protein
MRTWKIEKMLVIVLMMLKRRIPTMNHLMRRAMFWMS